MVTLADRKGELGMHLNLKAKDGRCVWGCRTRLRGGWGGSLFFAGVGSFGLGGVGWWMWHCLRALAQGQGDVPRHSGARRWPCGSEDKGPGLACERRRGQGQSCQVFYGHNFDNCAAPAHVHQPTHLLLLENSLQSTASPLCGLAS